MNQRQSVAPGAPDNPIGGHQDGVNLVGRRRLGGQGQHHRYATYSPAHRTHSLEYPRQLFAVLAPTGDLGTQPLHIPPLSPQWGEEMEERLGALVEEAVVGVEPRQAGRPVQHG